MGYDFDEIARRVKNAKRKFILKMLLIVAVASGSVALSVILNNEALIIPTVLVVAVMILLSARVIKRCVPTVLFSQEIKGENIKEHEYAASLGGSVNVGYPKARMVTMPHTFANRKAPPIILKGRVYLRLEDGNIREIGGLYKSHVDIYEEGDILLKPRGARFPIIVSRDADEQPCPLCGEINGRAETSCAGCGLGITRAPQP